VRWILASICKLYAVRAKASLTFTWLLLLGMCASRRTGGWEAVGCPPDKIRPTYEAANRSRVQPTATASFSENTNQDINSRSRALLCRLSFSAFFIASLVRVSPIAFISMAVTTTLRTQYVLMEKLTALLGRLFHGQSTVTVRSLPWRPRWKLC
jgi:hypothetical protein